MSSSAMSPASASASAPQQQLLTKLPTTSEGWRDAWKQVIALGDYASAAAYYEIMARRLESGADRDEILGEAQRELAAMPHTLVNDPQPLQSFPVPLPIRIAIDDTKTANPDAMPDRLKATLSNADVEKNPPLEPWNYWRNASWNSTFNFTQVAGVDDAKNRMKTALIDPYQASNYFPPSLTTNGIMLYGVAGTGKTTLSTAAVNALSIKEDGVGRYVVNPAGFRTEAEVAALVANPKLPNWAARYWGATPPVRGAGKKKKKQAADVPYTPVASRGEPELFKTHSFSVPDPTEGADKQVLMLPIPKVIFLQVTVADVKSVWVGESSRRLERWFELAREVQPAILFFDEAETYLDPSDEHNADAITTFKQQFGGIAASAGVTVIVATNYPMKVEAAIRSRLAAGAVEVGLPGLAARKAMIAYEIDRAFAPSMLKPDRYVENRTAVVDFIARRTSPPFVGAATKPSRYGVPAAGGKRRRSELADAPAANADDTASAGLWSGRDLKALVIFGLGQARSKLITDKAKVVPCAAGSTTGPCANYNVPTGQTAYVPSETGRTTTQDIVNEGRGAQLQPAAVTLKDFDEAFKTFSGSVDANSVKDQVLFNAERGMNTTNAGEQAQNWTNWRVSGKEDKYDPETKYPVLGANTTVPAD